MQKFDAFFGVRKNVIFERARFNRRKQQEGESAEQFIMELYRLAENCNYGELQSEMIRDRLVVGITDGTLSERLQLDPELTLEKAKKMVRQREAVHEQQKTLNGGASNSGSTLDEVKSKRNWKGKPNKAQPNNYRKTRSRACNRCGNAWHPWDKCPAKEAECAHCQKRGHYSTQCYFKRMSEVSIGDNEDLDHAFLDNITNSQEKSWFASIRMDGQSIDFKLDTGAEVTAISELTFQTLKHQVLQKPDKLLYGPSRQALGVAGKFIGELSHKNINTKQDVYVVKGLKTNLLGLPAITSLNLGARIHNAVLGKQEVQEQFPHLFKGLGNMGEEYEIKLLPNSKPFAIFTPRNVPLPLRSKTQEELERMEALKVISKVEEPTPWCAGMVVIPKKSGSVRICVDLKNLNENVLREVYPLPKVDDILAQISGGKLFSKLDANSGFWQIPLAPKSRLLTTFLTPFGRYCFNKLPFGITSAPEHFQKRMSTILAGLEGVLVLIDDVLIWGKDEKEHNDRLTAALNRVSEAGVTLNGEKCKYGKTSIEFLGHLLSSEGIQADPAKISAIVQMQPPKNVSELRRFLGTQCD